MMLSPDDYLDVLFEAGVSFFTGVPDSLLQQICACVTDKLPAKNHVIAANEGGAVGLAIGYHLATNEVPLIYLQNSGLGNVVNPVLSLASPEIYGIPSVFLIGWRGEPGKKDEPQHVHQGRVTEQMLEAMGIPVWLLSFEMEEARAQTKEAAGYAKRNQCPVALLVRKDTFGKYELASSQSDLELEREDAIILAAEAIEESAVVVSTTGMASRELFEYRARSGTGHQRDFLTVGGMGHASQIALGLAMNDAERPVYCFDGDGAALMHMGSLAISGQSNCANFIHLVLNNGAHESVGGQPTLGFQIDFPQIAAACGYASSSSVDTVAGLNQALLEAKRTRGPSFIEVRVLANHRADIGRPTSTPLENKTALMDFIGSTNGGRGNR